MSYVPKRTIPARCLLTALALLSLALTALLAFASPALAARTAEAPITGFTNPLGLSVDGSNNLWVSDINPSVHKVKVYSSAGALLHENAGTGSWFSSEYIESLAFSAAASKVFVSDSAEDDLWGLNAADATYSGTDLKPLGVTECCYLRVAADNSAGATGGDLYVARSGTAPNEVLRITGSGAAANFTASGSYISGNALTGTGTETFQEPIAVAVDSSGHLFVGDRVRKKVYEFEPSGAFLRSFAEPGGQAFGAIAGVAVDPTTGNVLVSDFSAGKVDEFQPDGTFVESISVSAPRGLALDSTGRLYVTNGSEVALFSSAAAAPSPKTLTVEVTGNGEVETVAPGIEECEESAGTCEADFPEGSTVILQESAAPGNHFVSWTGCTPVTGHPTQCEVTMTADETVAATFAASVPRTLTVEVTGNGEVNSVGAGIEECEEPSSPCEHLYAEGTTVTLEAEAFAGNHFVNWTGCTPEAGHPTRCHVEMTADKTVTATFAASVPRTLTVEVTGHGEVNSVGAGIEECEEPSSPCEHLYAEGTTVTLEAEAFAGNHFVNWTGCTPEAGHPTRCHVEMTADKTVTATFTPNLPEFPLTVIITGHGTVTSSPVGLICTNPTHEECTEEFEEGSVTLTASPGPEYTFAGWIGCKHTGPGTCTVAVTAATEVTAVFLTEGVQGQNGQTPTITLFSGGSEPAGNPCAGRGGVDIALGASHTDICNGATGANGTPGSPGASGKNIVVRSFAANSEPAGNPCHVAGGVEVEVEGEPSTKQILCNGATGASGAPGANGKDLIVHSFAPDGEPAGNPCHGAGGVEVEVDGQPLTRRVLCNGASGTDGASGTEGPQGKAGPQGKEGPPGPEGQVKVTCKVRHHKVKCTATPTNRRHRLRWRLMRAGHAVSHGTTHGTTLRLKLGHLRPGSYTLHIRGQRGATRIEIA